MNKQTPFLSYTKEYQNITEVFARTPEKFRSILTFSQHVMRSESELTDAEHELIAAYVSLLNSCKFCHGAHQQVAKNLGLNTSLLKALESEPLGDVISDKIRPILEFTKKLTEEPSKIIQSDIQKILDKGWSEKTVEDIVYIVSLFAFYNRFADGLGFIGTAEGYAINGEYLAKNGYTF